MSATVNDALLLVGDYTAANTGQNDQSARIRAITQSVAYFQRKLALPSDEKIHSFYYSDDQFFYTVPTGFEEELDIMYNDATFNTIEREWSFKEYSDLLKRSGESPSKNQWSFTTINGSRQIVLIGENINSGSTVDELDSVGNWVASGDASGLAADTLIKKVGDGSLSFDITNSSGLATLTRSGMTLDVQSIFENHGYFKFWNYMTSAIIDSVILKLYVNDSKYWTITETDLDDGSAFSTNAWKKLGFPTDNAVKTGAPEVTEDVTKISITYDLGSGLTSAADFRIDHLYTTIPDYLDLAYRSSYKGANSSGTSITSFTDINDTIAMCNYSELFLDLIARRAAMSLWPALRGDKEFYGMYASEIKEMERYWGLRFPKRRTNKAHDTKLRR